MAAATVIVCEAAGKWAAGLRGRLSKAARLVETRRIDEIWERLVEDPAALAAIEWRAGDALLRLRGLARLAREFPRANCVVLADRPLAAWETVVREAGAVDFLVGPRRLSDLAAMAEHKRRTAAPCPPHRAGETVDEADQLQQQIWQSLPWPRGEYKT